MTREHTLATIIPMSDIVVVDKRSNLVLLQAGRFRFLGRFFHLLGLGLEVLGSGLLSLGTRLGPGVIGSIERGHR